MPESITPCACLISSVKLDLRQLRQARPSARFAQCGNDEAQPVLDQMLEFAATQAASALACQ